MKPTIVVSLLLALLLPHVARAQPASAQAEVLFRRGRTLMEAKKYAEACAEFAESQKLDPAITTLINLAGCYEKLGQLATAWGLFLDAERQTRGAEDPTRRQLHDVADMHATKLEPRLSTLTIQVADANRVPGLEIRRDDMAIDPAAWNQPLPIDGGTYVLHASAPGVPAWSTRVTVGGEHDAKVVTIPRLAAAEAPHPVETPHPATPVATKPAVTTAPARTAPAASAPAAPASAAPEKWFCASSRHPEVGACKPDAAACLAFRSSVRAYVHDLTDCEEAPAAVCFTVGREDHCAPDDEICDSLRAAAVHGAGGSTVSPCETRESASASRARVAREKAEAARAASAYHGPVWSCTDSSSGTFGTCRPQPADCEAFRSSMLERFPDLTGCHDQRVAQCFNLGREAHCAPSAEICDQLRDLAARQHGAPSKCYAASAPADAHRE